VQTQGTITFVADVGEEGLSDLRGMRSGAHSPAEAFDATDSWKGTERVLLLVVALARQ